MPIICILVTEAGDTLQYPAHSPWYHDLTNKILPRLQEGRITGIKEEFEIHCYKSNSKTIFCIAKNMKSATCWKIIDEVSSNKISLDQAYNIREINENRSVTH